MNITREYPNIKNYHDKDDACPYVYELPPPNKLSSISHGALNFSGQYLGHNFVLKKEQLKSTLGKLYNGI